MKNVILHVTFTCKPGMAQDLVRALKDSGLQQAVREEAGCIQYDYTISCEVPDTVVLLECWRDADALTVHSNQPRMKELNRVAGQFTTNVVIQRFE